MEKREEFRKRYMRVLGKLLREKRGEKKLTQEQLAELVDLHEKHISQIERGIKMPLLKTADDISQALHISLDTVLDKVREEMRKSNLKKDN